MFDFIHNIVIPYLYQYLDKQYNIRSAQIFYHKFPNDEFIVIETSNNVQRDTLINDLEKIDIAFQCKFELDDVSLVIRGPQ